MGYEVDGRGEPAEMGGQIRIRNIPVFTWGPSGFRFQVCVAYLISI
jgi:hypothetical protein